MRTRTIISQKHLSVLKVKLQQTFGKTVSRSVDCDHLSNHIKISTGEIISAQTLRRIFGFIKSPFSPSVTNLDILAQYCGFLNWSDLRKSPTATNFQPLSSEAEASFYLNFFKIEVTKEADINYHNACRNIAERILSSENLFNQLASPLAENKTAQIFFYERFPFLDGLGSFYPRGIRLYLKNKKDVESQIFGSALLLLSCVLTGHAKDAIKAYGELSRYNPTKSFHPFVTARFIGSNILYKKTNGLNYQDELDAAFEYGKYFSTASKISFWYFPFYQFMLCDYLNLSGLFEESRNIISLLKTPTPEFIVEQGYPETWEAIRHISNHQQSPLKYLKWLDNFNWGRINFIFRKYYKIQALSAALATEKTNERKTREINKELKELIAATGYKHFQLVNQH